MRLWSWWRTGEKVEQPAGIMDGSRASRTRAEMCTRFSRPILSKRSACAPRACTPHSSGQRVCRAVRVACIAAQCGAAGSNTSTCIKIHMLITIITHAWQWFISLNKIFHKWIRYMISCSLNKSEDNFLSLLIMIYDIILRVSLNMYTEDLVSKSCSFL